MRNLLSGKALLRVHSLVRGSKHSTSVIVILSLMLRMMRIIRGEGGKRKKRRMAMRIVEDTPTLPYRS